MGPIISFVIFISVILLLSFLMNYYVLWRLFGFFQIKKGIVFWFVIVITTVSLVGASVLHSYSANIISTIIYSLAANWYGILWLFFSTIVVYEILRFFIKIKPPFAGAIIISVVFIATAYSLINAQFIRINKLAIPGNTDINIVQLSDIHIGSVGTNYFRRIIDKTNDLDPDIVLITGDLVDNFNEETQDAIKLLKQISAPAYFVTGNHEGYVGPERVIESLKDVNVNVLRNEKAQYNEIDIIGVDDNIARRELDEILEQIEIDDERFSILMYHKPIQLKEFGDINIDLVLSGHTHKGQIFPFNFLVGIFHKPLSGFHRYNNTYQYVTSGTGTWGPRMRLGSNSEIALLQIKKVQDD